MELHPLSIGDIPALMAVGTYTATNSSATLVGSGTPLLAGQKVILENSTGVIGTVAFTNNGNNITLNDKWAGPSATGILYTAVDDFPQDVADYYSGCDALGTLAQRSAYDSQADGFVYLQTDTNPTYWIRTGSTAGVWKNAAITIICWSDANAGNDTTGDGSFSQPFQTVQASVNWISAFGDLSGLTVWVALKAGVYVEAVLLKDVIGTPLVLKITDEIGLSNIGGASTVSISGGTLGHAINAVGLKSVWFIEHIALKSQKGHGLYAKAARLRFNRCEFWQTTGAHIAALGGGHIALAGAAYVIAAGGSAHLLVNGSGATIDLQAEATVPNPVITIAAAAPFGTAFAWARASGQIFTGTGLTFPGKSSATGRRWRAEQNSSIDSGQSGENYLPGTAGNTGKGVTVKNGEYL